MRVKINDVDVVHEVIDGEVILFDLSTGCYYAGNVTATDLLSLFLNGNAVDVVQTRLKQRAVGHLAPERIDAAISSMLDYLQAERLVTVAAGQEAACEGLVLTDAELDDVLERYVDPVFEKYSDMKEMLLLDPIHDVGAQGWPHPADAASKTDAEQSAHDARK